MKAYTMISTDFTVSSNQVKEIFLEAMVKEGQITKEQQDAMNNYCITVVEKGFFGKLWDKLWSDSEDNYFNIVVVKIVE